MKIGQSGSEKGAKRGRPKKKPNYCKEDQIENLIDSVTSRFGAPYDDRDERDPDAPTIEGVGNELGINPVKIRKLLITADYFSTAISRQVNILQKQGDCIKEIMEKTGLSKASVYSYLPYSKGAYKLKEPTLYAEQTRLFRRRKNACEKLAEKLLCKNNVVECGDCLWESILAFENYPFVKNCGERFQYLINDDCIICNGLRITRKQIEEAFYKVRKAISNNSMLSLAEILNCIGSEELIAIFLRIGVCEKS